MQLPKDLLGKYEVKKHDNLFGLDFSNVDKMICPICFGKLRKMRFKPLLFCASKKHKKAFVCKA